MSRHYERGLSLAPTLNARRNESQNDGIVLLRPAKVSGCPQLRACPCNSDFLSFAVARLIVRIFVIARFPQAERNQLRGPARAITEP